MGHGGLPEGRFRCNDDVSVVPEHPSGMSPGRYTLHRHGAHRLSRIAPAAKISSMLQCGRPSTAAHQMSSGVLNLPTAALPHDEIERSVTTPLPSSWRKPRGCAISATATIVSYSRKVFIPLTQLCRDVCHYCTFAQPPRRGERAYLSPDEVLEIARAGAAPAARRRCSRSATSRSCATRRRARRWHALGYATTLAYLARWRRWCCKETGLLPHLNPGRDDATRSRALREVSVSQGIMLESAVRAAVRAAAGRISARPTSCRPCAWRPSRRPASCAIPFTTGILIGIGETRAERIEALLAIRDLHDALRPHPGNHRPELPRQARHAHGATRRSRAGDHALDDRGRAADVRPGDEHPGAAEPAARRARRD